LSQAIRDRLMERWKATHQVYKLTLFFCRIIVFQRWRKYAWR